MAGSGEPVACARPLAFNDVVDVAIERRPVALDEATKERVRGARSIVEEAADSGRLVYGITTGIGDLARVRVEATRLAQLQRELVRSHAAAVGPPLPTEVVRAMMLLKAGTFTTGVSGVRLELVTRFIELLNAGIHPIVPSQGSLGASGDLALLAHLALPLMGEGTVEVDGVRKPAADALADAALVPLDLSYKEGLSLINGTEGMLALGILALHGAERLSDAADAIGAMTVEATLGTDRSFGPDVMGLRPHPGALAVAENLRTMLDGSEIVASHKTSDHLVQDAYSLRCIPQVHGAYREAMGYVRRTLENEMASAIDNPSVILGTGEVVSGGNFHGEALGLALDHLALCLTGYATISERRIARLVDPNLNQGLPAFLSSDPGQRSGFMIAHYTAASLVSESRSMSFPASADSIPTSAGQEDHVSMGATSGRKALAILANTEHVLAIEALAAAQALDHRAPLEPASRTQRVMSAIRSVSPTLEEDRALSEDIQKVRDLLREGTLGAPVSESR
ncbi:MAG TPA: histidine ammonia-lyase [Actinomycetota bacterium]|nr:histidine ammonia-lyase [Actinomycetota bacterium]